MAIDGNLVCKYLNEIKKKHGLSNKRWAEISSVPLGTINRYMSYNVGVPSFLHVCAMLECLNEPLEEFYKSVNIAIEKTPPAAVPAATVADVAASPDPSAVAALREAISIQSEVLVEQAHNAAKKEAAIDEIRSDVDSLREELAQKDVTIARLETEVRHKKKQNRILVSILLVLAVLEVLLANYGFVRGLF